MNIKLPLISFGFADKYIFLYHLVTEREILFENFCFYKQKDKKCNVRFVCHSGYVELKASK